MTSWQDLDKFKTTSLEQYVRDLMNAGKTAVHPDFQELLNGPLREKVMAYALKYKQEREAAKEGAPV